MRFSSCGKSLLAAHAARIPRQLFGHASDGFGILMYHRVIEAPAGFPSPTWNVPPARLRQQLGGLLRLGFQAASLRSVLAAHRAGDPIPPKTFVVTFDDGFANNFTHALPVLRELSVPATVFVSTAYLGSKAPFPSDDWSAAGAEGCPAEAWRALTVDECDRLAADPLIELGCHTHSHADFRGRPEALEWDLDLNRQELARWCDAEPPLFAFPYGTKSLGFSGPLLAEAARRAGMACALTTEDELVEPGDDPFDWGRLTAEDFDTAETLAAKLSGWYGRIRSVWRRLKPAEGATEQPFDRDPEDKHRAKGRAPEHFGVLTAPDAPSPVQEPEPALAEIAS